MEDFIMFQRLNQVEVNKLKQTLPKAQKSLKSVNCCYIYVTLISANEAGVRMARITQEEKERKKEIFDKHITQVFLKDGWGAVNYNRIAKDLGISKSSLQKYYPYKSNFLGALKGRVFHIITDNIDFSSSKSFIDSWLYAYQHVAIFTEVNHMLIDIVANEYEEHVAQQGINRIISLLAEQVGEEEAKNTLQLVVGKIMFIKLYKV